MIALVPYALIIAGPFISFWLGWWARGMWDKAGRNVERLASLNGPVSDEEWDQIVQTIKEGK